MADKYEMVENNYQIKCSMYVSDIELEAHIKDILKIKE